MSSEDNKNEKTKKNNIIFYTITGLIFLLNILGWISFKKNYNEKNSELLKIKSLEGENYYKKKLIVGIKEVKNELLKELCDFVYYYTKIKK